MPFVKESNFWSFLNPAYVLRICMCNHLILCQSFIISFALRHVHHVYVPVFRPPFSRQDFFRLIIHWCHQLYRSMTRIICNKFLPHSLHDSMIHVELLCVCMYGQCIDVNQCDSSIPNSTINEMLILIKQLFSLLIFFTFLSTNLSFMVSVFMAKFTNSISCD